MKGFMKKGGLLAIVLCLFLTGCGEEVYTMTPEEESLIVTYAAGAVAKSNKTLNQGLTFYREEKTEETQEPEEEQTASESPDTSQEDVSNTEEQQGDTSTQESGVQESTLTDALALTPIVATYESYQVADHYVEGSYFALRAEAGTQYLIVNIGLSNPTGQQVDCNIFSKGVSCQLLINDTSQVAAMTTILENDFATYIGTLEPGASQETILIFQVSDEEAENIQNLAMEVQMDGTTYRVDLQ